MPLPASLASPTRREFQALKRLFNVSLKGCAVSCVEDGLLGSAAPRIRELDLRENLLRGWEDIARIGAQLPGLQVLNLADNAVENLPREDSATAELLEGKFPRLQVLILSGTGVGWDTLVRAARHMPRLVEAHLCSCGVESLAPPAMRSAGGAEPKESESESESGEDGAALLAEAFPLLERLSLNDNSIADWREAWRLRTLPCLGQLQLNGNKLTQMAYSPGMDALPPLPLQPPSESAVQYAIRCARVADPAAAAAARAGATSSGASTEPAAVVVPGVGGISVPAEATGLPFHRLHTLCLSNNPIGSWAAVDALVAFPALSRLRLKDAKVFEEAGMGPSAARQHVIARLPGLLVLNGSEVRGRERTDAEKVYAREAARMLGNKGVGKAAVAAPGSSSAAAPEGAAAGGAREGAAAGTQELATPAAAIAAAHAELRGAAVGAVGEEIVTALESGAGARAPGKGRPGPGAADPTAMVAGQASCLVAAVNGSGGLSLATGECAGLSSSSVAQARLAGLLKEHPRGLTLLAVHPEVVAQSAVSQSSSRLEDRTVRVTIRSMAARSCTAEPIQKRLPLTMQVLQVKQMASRAFKVAPSMQRVCYRDQPNAFPSVMEDDRRTLQYYAVPDGAEILIEEVDEKEIAKEAAIVEAEKEQKLREQAAEAEMLARMRQRAMHGEQTGAAIAAST